MLEKNDDFFVKNEILCDAHFHYAECLKNEDDLKITWNACSCAHSIEEWEVQKNAPDSVIRSFGLHPQVSAKKDFNLKRNADFLEGLLEERLALLASNDSEGKGGGACDDNACAGGAGGDSACDGRTLIRAIGEAGFDYFTPEFKERQDLQEEMWNIQLELAAQYSMPLVVHCRKANEKLFEYAPVLKKLPAVLFHSFMGSAVEAESLIRRGINCCFSFGKQMSNGNKKVIECVQKLPMKNLLLETDAPFQTLKGESFTRAEEIRRVYVAFCELRKIEYGIAADIFYNNFTMIFGA